MGAQSTATVDFGSTGKQDASAVITGQASILAGSLVEAWLFPIATADHTADEHLVEDIVVRAHSIVAGTGFTITAYHPGVVSAAGQEVRGRGGFATPKATYLRGLWTVAWCWNAIAGLMVAVLGGCFGASW